MRIKGDIAVFEIADHAHADEVFLLDFDPFLRISQALLAEFERSHVGTIFAGVFEDRVFDRQAMGIPARYVNGFVAGHVSVSDDDVFQGLIESVADMDLAIGIWRAIVENESRCAALLSLFDSLFI